MRKGLIVAGFFLLVFIGMIVAFGQFSQASTSDNEEGPSIEPGDDKVCSGLKPPAGQCTPSDVGDYACIQGASKACSWTCSCQPPPTGCIWIAPLLCSTGVCDDDGTCQDTTNVRDAGTQSS